MGCVDLLAKNKYDLGISTNTSRISAGPPSTPMGLSIPSHFRNILVSRHLLVPLTIYSYYFIREKLQKTKLQTLSLDFVQEHEGENKARRMNLHAANLEYRTTERLPFIIKIIKDI